MQSTYAVQSSTSKHASPSEIGSKLEAIKDDEIEKVLEQLTPTELKHRTALYTAALKRTEKLHTTKPGGNDADKIDMQPVHKQEEIRAQTLPGANVSRRPSQEQADSASHSFEAPIIPSIAQFETDSVRPSVAHDLPARCTQPIPEECIGRDTLMWAFHPEAAAMVMRAREEFSRPNPPPRKRQEPGSPSRWKE